MHRADCHALYTVAIRLCTAGATTAMNTVRGGASVYMTCTLMPFISSAATGLTSPTGISNCPTETTILPASTSLCNVRTPRNVQPAARKCLPNIAT